MSDGELVVHLGSGLFKEIVDRSHSDPSIRICVQEPSNETVKYRATCGNAEITPSGPAPVSQPDEAERRGAWVRTLPIGEHIWTLLIHSWRHRPQDLAIANGLETAWIEVAGATIREASLESALSAFAEVAPSEMETRVFVRFGGAPDEVQQALSLLSDSLPAADPDAHSHFNY